MESNDTFLTDLRARILKDIIPLAIEATGGGTDRFELMLRIIQTGDAPRDLYSRAYETAKSIDNTEDRLDALMALLDEVEYRAVPDEQDEEGDTDNATNEPASVPEPPAEADHQP